MSDVSLPLSPDGQPRFRRAVIPDLDDPDLAPVLGLSMVFPDQYDISIRGTPGLSYQIEMTSDLRNWFPMFRPGITIPPNGNPVVVGIGFPPSSRFGAFRGVLVGSWR